MGISPLPDEISFWNCLETYLRCLYTSSKCLQILYVCQSVSWLTYLLKWGQYRDISCPGWDTFLNFFGDIPWMFLHYSQTMTHFLYVCNSVRWLTSLLKLAQYRDISCSGWDMFLTFFLDIPRMFVQYFQIITNFLFVCQSVSWLTLLLKLG